MNNIASGGLLSLYNALSKFENVFCFNNCKFFQINSKS